MELTHFNDQGRAKMVDVSQKAETVRDARATVQVRMCADTREKIQNGQMKKGDVLAVAQVAGIMAAKKTGDLIPMCHPLLLSAVDIAFSWVGDTLEIEACVRCTGQTGVEMEALTAASTAALTVYDMCKAVERGMVITDLRLLHKSGGKSGVYDAPEQEETK